ncbi:NifU family protein [Rhodobacter sp. Har01]|uniref:NifU family protein n=1 Tax=Rhodobacter sp. Har01 TaxID=2883999 RepID=UPI001D068989|nr:NifU family protein [Rhodobacter sp. Har01]MCB6178322.1 NifU family protein [Rhodobacter sp. Har01]
MSIHDPAVSDLLAACACGLDAARAEAAIRDDRLTTLAALRRALGAAEDCPDCTGRLQGVLARVTAAMATEGLLAADEVYLPPDLSRQPPAMRARRSGAPVQISLPAAVARPAVPVGSAAEMALAAAVIEEMRPRLIADGGDVELVDIQGIRVLVRMTGACAGCQIAGLTLGGLSARMTSALGRPVRCVPVAR